MTDTSAFFADWIID